MDIKEQLSNLDEEVTKYTRGYPNMRKNRNALLKRIEEGMDRLLKDIEKPADGLEYNKLIDKLNTYYDSDEFKEKYGSRIVRRPDVKVYEEEMKQEEPPMRDEEMSEASPKSEMDTPRSEMMETPKEPPMPIEPSITPRSPDSKSKTPRKEEKKEEKKEEMNEEEREEEEEREREEEEEREEEREDEREEEREEEREDDDMEEIHNQIRKDERERVMREFNIVDPTIGTIDIPKERLGIEGKTIKILNDDIKYFLERFPDMLKMEADVYKKTNKKNKKLLQDIHRRIQAKLSSPEKTERVGIILDADKFIDMKITELLAAKTLEGLTPANLVDITEEPKSKGRDIGSYTIVRKGGRDVINSTPVYRAIPSTQPERKEQRGEIPQSTIYKNSGKTKVDIAKMEMRDNPFIRQTQPKRLNIIL